MTTTAPTYTDEERVTLQRACVAGHISLENASDHNIANVMEKTFATHDVFYDIVPGNAGRLTGTEGVVGFYEMLFSVLPDIHVEIIHQYDVPGCCVLEGYVTGTPLRPVRRHPRLGPVHLVPVRGDVPVRRGPHEAGGRACVLGQ